MYIFWIFTILFIKSSFEEKLTTHFPLLEIDSYSQSNFSSFPCILKYCELLLDRKSLSPNLMVIMATTQIQQDILNNLFDTHNYDIIVFNTNLNFLSNSIVVKPKPNNYIIFIENINELTEIEKILIQQENINPLTPIIIIFTKKYLTNPIINIEVNFVFQRLLSLHFYNAYGIVIKSNSSIEVFTWYPYDNKNCGKIVKNIQKISTCHDSEDILSFVNKNLTQLLVKIPKRNLNNKCPLKIAIRVWEPYVVMQNDENYFTGIDIDLIKFIAESLNVIPVYYPQTNVKQDIFKDLIER